MSEYSAHPPGSWILETTKTGEVYKRFTFGTKDDIPVTGDWNNDGHSGCRSIPPIHRELDPGNNKNRCGL